jgi:hypothetical protein
MAYRPPSLQPRSSMQQGAQVPPRAFSGRGTGLDTLIATQINKQRPPDLQPVRPMQQGTGIPMNMPVFVPEQGAGMMPASPASNWGKDLRERVGKLAAVSLAKKAIPSDVVQEAEQTQMLEEEQQRNSLQQMAMKNAIVQALSQSAMRPEGAVEEGGLIGMAQGGEFAGRVPGKGHGMEDNVRMPIKEDGKQVATLAVSPSEYVVDSHTMAALGNGNADRGADVMDATVKQIRQKAYGTEKQPREISGPAALKPLIERV